MVDLNRISFSLKIIICSVIYTILFFLFSENNIKIMISILFGVVILHEIQKKYLKLIINPIELFCIGWIIPLALTQLKLSELQQDFSQMTWEIIILTTILFLFPSLIMIIVVKNKENKNILFQYNVDELAKPLILITILIVFIIICQWVYLRGIPLFSGESEVSHLDSMKFASYFVALFPYISGLSIFYIVLGGKKFKKVIFLIILLPYMYSVLQMLRSYMLNAIYVDMCYIYLAYIIKIKKINKVNLFCKKIAIVLICLLIVLMPIIGKARVTSQGAKYENGLYWTNVIGLKVNNETLSWLYSYYVMGIDNFNFFINNYNGPKTYGYTTLMPIIGPLQLKNMWYVKPGDIQNIIPVLWSTATGTYLREIYIDGGFIYTLIVVLILSIFINLMYYNIIKNGLDVKFYSIYIIFSYGIIYMFFNSGALFSASNITNLFITYYLLKRYVKKLSIKE